MGQSNYNKTRYFYSDGVVYKQKGDQAPVSIGTKWMKVYKVLLCIGTILGLFSLLPILANLVSLFYGFPVVYGLTCLLVNVADVAFTFAAYTALCSLSKKRYIYIIIQIIVKLVSIGVITYGQYYTASLLFRMLMVGLIIAFFSVAWSLPNIIYFKHRECMFIGDDPEEDVKIGRVASEGNAIPNAGEIDKAETNIDPAPQAKAKVKVIPVKIGSDKQEGKAKQSKGEQRKNEKQVVSVKSVKQNPISLYVFIILFVVASVVCVWQADQLSAARDDVTTLQGTVSAAEAKIKVQASEIEKQNGIIDGLHDQIDKLYGEVNRLLGYRKYLTIADFKRSYQESLDETREITIKYG